MIVFISVVILPGSFSLFFSDPRYGAEFYRSLASNRECEKRTKKGSFILRNPGHPFIRKSMSFPALLKP